MASATAEATVETGGKKGSSKLLLILLPLLLLVGGGAGAYFAGLLPIGGAKAGESAEDGHGAAKAKGEHLEAGQTGAIHALEPFIANLADEDGSRYLKTTIQIEFTSVETPRELEARLPQIRDLVLTLLTSKTFAQIRSPEGKERLREEVVERINHVLEREAVRSVYFTEFIVQ